MPNSLPNRVAHTHTHTPRHTHTYPPPPPDTHTHNIKIGRLAPFNIGLIPIGKAINWPYWHLYGVWHGVSIGWDLKTTVDERLFGPSEDRRPTTHVHPHTHTSNGLLKRKQNKKDRWDSGKPHPPTNAFLWHPDNRSITAGKYIYSIQISHCWKSEWPWLWPFKVSQCQIWHCHWTRHIGFPIYS